MAVSAQSVLDVQTGGSNSSGGGFSLAGNIYSITDLAGSNANTTTPTVSSASYTFTNNDVGYFVYIASGTNWYPGLYPILSQSGGVATLGQPWPQVGSWSGVASTASPTSGSATICRIPKTTAWTNGTNLTVDATTNTDVAPDGYTVTNADVGNWIQITTTGGGAAFAVGYYQITRIVSGKWRLDRSPAATSSSGATWAMGGSLATITTLASAAAGQNHAFVKSGTYTQTATATFAAGGSSTLTFTRVIGYYQKWGDIAPTSGGARVYSNNANRPFIQLSTNTGLTGLRTTQNFVSFENFIVDGAALGTSAGVVNAATGRVINCFSRKTSNGGITCNTGYITDCEATSNTGGVAISGTGSPFILRCHAHDNSTTGIQPSNQGIAIQCLAVNNSGASSDGINANQAAIGCTSFNNGRDGIRVANIAICRNNISAKNAAYGITGSSGATADPSTDGNAFWSNTSGTRNLFNDGAPSVASSPTNAANLAGYITPALDVSLSADPFVKASVPVADLTVDGSNNLKVTSSSYTFVAGDVGATLYITNQTGGWTAGEYTIASVSSNAAILTASPGTVGSSSGNWYFNNFRLNNTVGGGYSAKAAGTPGALPGTANVGYPDMGALQSANYGGAILAGL